MYYNYCYNSQFLCAASVEQQTKKNIQKYSIIIIITIYYSHVKTNRKK